MSREVSRREMMPDGGRGDYGDAVNRKGHAALCGRKGIGENGLLARLQAAPSGTLQDAANDKRGQVRRQSAQE
jgi:hypothetical protein